MKTLLRFFPTAFAVLFLTLFMTSCAAIGDVFKAGAYTGIIGVVLGAGSCRPDLVSVQVPGRWR